jgi:outer membrane protein assembly factor BamE (lipoprotein component of BamABCDE complex)
LAALTLVLATACAPVVRNHGYVPSDQELAADEVGTDTRDSVAEKVGRPSVQGLLDDTAWFYVQSRWETRGARAAQEVDRQVLAISFNEAGTVANIERFGLERGKIVPLSRRVTESSVQGMGVLRQLLGNLGRLNAGQLLSD